MQSRVAQGRVRQGCGWRLTRSRPPSVCPWRGRAARTGSSPPRSPPLGTWRGFGSGGGDEGVGPGIGGATPSVAHREGIVLGVGRAGLGPSPRGARARGREGGSGGTAGGGGGVRVQRMGAGGAGSGGGGSGGRGHVIVSRLSFSSIDLAPFLPCARAERGGVRPRQGARVGGAQSCKTLLYAPCPSPLQRTERTPRSCRSVTWGHRGYGD